MERVALSAEAARNLVALEDGDPRAFACITNAIDALRRLGAPAGTRPCRKSGSLLFRFDACGLRVVFENERHYLTDKRGWLTVRGFTRPGTPSAYTIWSIRRPPKSGKPQ